MVEIRATGIAWYYRQDYRRILEIMVDAHKLPTTYDQWIKVAERAEREMKGKGHVVVRAMIDPDEFPVWCRQRALKLDAQARMTFANEVAYREVKDTH